MELGAKGENSYAEKAEIGAALRVFGAGLGQRLALPFAATATTATTTSFKGGAAWSSDRKGNKGQSENNGGFEELHDWLSENVVKSMRLGK